MTVSAIVIGVGFFLYLVFGWGILGYLDEVQEEREKASRRAGCSFDFLSDDHVPYRVGREDSGAGMVWTAEGVRSVWPVREELQMTSPVRRPAIMPSGAQPNVCSVALLLGSMETTLPTRKQPESAGQTT